jgi:hypothetical protein
MIHLCFGKLLWYKAVVTACATCSMRSLHTIGVWWPGDCLRLCKSSLLLNTAMDTMCFQKSKNLKNRKISNCAGQHDQKCYS